MNVSWLRKARNAPKLLSTYRVGLVQAKAFRILNARTVGLLEPYGIRPLDWAMLGAVSEHPDGISPTELAGVLGVKPPHVTAMMTRLKRKRLANERADENDRRQKRIGLTPEGIRFVPRVERELRDGMRGLVKDARMKDLLAYVTVLSSIVDNGQED